MALLVSCTCCALVRASAECCGYLCYPSVVMRHDPCDQTLCPYPWFGAHVLYPCSWDATSSVTWYWLPNCGRSCDSHWDLISCIIGYLNSDLTVFVSDRIKGVHCLWWFVEWPQKGCLSTGSSQKATLGSLLQCSFFNNPLLYHNNKLMHGTPIHHRDQHR